MSTHYDVVVFGGTSGIGLASSLGFKKRGFSVLSVSRNANSTQNIKNHDILVKDLNILDIDLTTKFIAGIQSVKHVILSVSMPLQFDKLKDLMISDAKHSYEQIWAYLAIIQEFCKKTNAPESITVVSGAIAKTNAKGTIALKLKASTLNEIVKTLAVELAPIRINAISPYATYTPLYDQFENKEQMFIDMANAIPLKRIASPDEIADAVIFATLNKNVTGSIIDIDGGSSL